MDRVIFCVFLEVDYKIYKKKMNDFFPTGISICFFENQPLFSIYCLFTCLCCLYFYSFSKWFILWHLFIYKKHTKWNKCYCMVIRPVQISIGDSVWIGHSVLKEGITGYDCVIRELRQIIQAIRNLKLTQNMFYPWVIMETSDISVSASLFLTEYNKK